MIDTSLDQEHPLFAGFIIPALLLSTYYIKCNTLKVLTENYKFDFMHFSKYLSYQFPNLQVLEGKNYSHLHCLIISKSFLNKCVNCI